MQKRSIVDFRRKEGVFLERSERKRSKDSSLPDEDSILIDELLAYYEALSAPPRNYSDVI